MTSTWKRNCLTSLTSYEMGMSVVEGCFCMILMYMGNARGRGSCHSGIFVTMADIK